MAEVGPATTGFTVRGVRNGSIVTIGWDRGLLTGDPPTIDLLEIEADMAALSRADPVVQRDALLTERAGGVNPLARPETAMALIRHVMHRIIKVTIRP